MEKQGFNIAGRDASSGEEDEYEGADWEGVEDFNVSKKFSHFPINQHTMHATFHSFLNHRLLYPTKLRRHILSSLHDHYKIVRQTTSSKFPPSPDIYDKAGRCR